MPSGRRRFFYLLVNLRRVRSKNPNRTHQYKEDEIAEKHHPGQEKNRAPASDLLLLQILNSEGVASVLIQLPNKPKLFNSNSARNLIHGLQTLQLRAVNAISSRQI